MTPADREQLSADVRQAEGFRPKAYQDSLGVWTVGYGCNLQELTVTESWASIQMLHKLMEAEDDALSFPWYAQLDGNQQRAIVELLYNLGGPRFRGFTKMLTALARADYETAANQLEDSLWYRQVGPLRGKRLVEQLRG